MIKMILWVVLFLLIVALVPFVIGEKGYILIAMGDITIESTVVTATILLALLFVVLIMLLKLTRGSLHLGFGAWNKIAFAGRRRGQRNLHQGIAAFLLGDFQQAEHLLVKSAEPSRQPFLAYLTAAKAAHLQSKSANTDHYLQLADSQSLSLKDASLESILVQLNVLLARQEFNKARTIIDEHHKHIGHDARLLGLEIDLCIEESRYEAAIDRLKQASKNKELSSRLPAWYQRIYQGYFAQLDDESLQQSWQKLAKKTKQVPEVLLAYCNELAKRNIVEPIQKLLLPVIKKGADIQLINALKYLPLTSIEPFIQAVEKQLHKDASNTLWLSTLGHLAYTGKQYQLAEKALNSLQTHSDHFEKADAVLYAKVLCALDKHKQANQVLLSITE